MIVTLILGCAQPELRAEPIPVRYAEGLIHGFLILRAVDGRAVADGDLVQVASGGRVTTRLTFRFHDGSVHDETAIYTQQGRFRLVNYRLLQRGPAFPRAPKSSLPIWRTS